MRLVATATVCVVAAFGAAFLVGRAVSHQGAPPAAAATTTTTATVATRAAPTPATKATDVALASQFVPGLASLKRVKRRHHRHAIQHAAAPAVEPHPHGDHSGGDDARLSADPERSKRIRL